MIRDEMEEERQIELPGLGVPRSDGCLVLSIHSEHAARIFSGQKQYELRKVLPGSPFRRVFLYESGGRGIVGCFDVERVVHAGLDDLWERVGTRATTRERFRSYFSGRDRGYAIKIQNPVRFPTPILPKEIRDAAPTFTAPMSFLFARHGTSLFQLLEDERRKALEPRLVSLRPIGDADERSEFERLVGHFIAPRYDDITPAYAKYILETHDARRDVTGMFTSKKEVMAIESTGRLVGFTVLTSKSTGCIKTGPTVLFEAFRGQGFGESTRLAIHDHAVRNGMRKVYCTASSSADEVHRYLMRTGYRVEAHLLSHYKDGNSELVYGNLLVEPTATWQMSPRSRPLQASEVAVPGALRIGRDVRRIFNDRLFPLPARPIQLSDPRGSYDTKPRSLLTLSRRGARGPSELVAGIVRVPKRGGAAKCLLFTETAHGASLNLLIASAENLCRDEGRRKQFFVHPLTDTEVVEVLVTAGYHVEGVLVSAYRSGQDVAVLSKLL